MREHWVIASAIALQLSCSATPPAAIEHPVPQPAIAPEPKAPLPSAQQRAGHSAAPLPDPKDAELAERSLRLAELASAQAASASQPVVAEVPNELGNYTRDQVLRALGLENSGALRLVAARGLLGADSIVVLTYNAPEHAQTLSALAARVFLVAEVGGRLLRQASGRLRYPSGACIDHEPLSSGSKREFAFEPRLYKLEKERSAIAVRLSCSISEPSAEGEEDHTTLFVRDGKTLNAVLSFMQSGGSLDRVSRISTFEERELTILPTTHHSYFDVALQTTRSRRTAPLDDSPEQVLENTTERQIFAWDGSKYVGSSVVPRE